MTAFVFSQFAAAGQLATIKLNPLQVELSREAQDNIAEFDKNFVMHTFASYSEKVQKIFLDDPDTLNRETPMAILGYFDCDNTMDLAVKGTSRGRDVVVRARRLI